MQTPPPPARLRHTKIVATIGPACRDTDALSALLRAGVNVVRINCSHSTADSIRADVARVRRCAAACGTNVAILLDLQGPKIRTGPATSPTQLESGDVLTVVMDDKLHAHGKRIGTTWTRLAQDVRVGEPVLFADGALSGEVVAVRSDEVDIRIEDGGSLGSHKGINLPATNIQAPALTDKDRADLEVGIAAGVDYVALSFVRYAQDVLDLRDSLRDCGAEATPIIAKIEKPEAVLSIEEILEVCEGIMVARGDLGVEVPFEQVPVMQKQLIQAANSRGRLVITATQMLDSMERNPRPTRAEITDVANAIFDGTDAVMLSGETASGRYPIRAVEVMDRIARQVEGSKWEHRPDLGLLHASTSAEGTVLRAACWAVQVAPRPLVVFTWSGSTAVKASKGRPPSGLFAITHDQKVCDRLSLVWGVRAVRIPLIEGTDDLIAAGETALIELGAIERGTEIVILAGQAPMRGATNMMKVEIVDGRSDGVQNPH